MVRGNGNKDMYTRSYLGDDSATIQLSMTTTLLQHGMWTVSGLPLLAQAVLSRVLVQLK